MSANGRGARLPEGMTICACGQAFTPRFASERYCSNVCAGEHGTPRFPAAKPIEKPGPPLVIEPPPPRAIARMRQWVHETRNVRWPS